MSSEKPTGTTPTEVPGEKHEQGHSLSDKGRQGQHQQGQQGGQAQQQGGQQNEGEGNRTAARQYNEAARQSAADPARTERQAAEAKRAIDSPEGDELEAAEEIGKKPARH